MKGTKVQAYLLSLAVGTLVGCIYASLKVKSPAPPLIALLGLLGILIGERYTPYFKERLFSSPAVIQTKEKTS